MVTAAYPCPKSISELSVDINWSDLYPRLLFIAKRLVYKYRLPGWYGQEEDIALDVAQETAKRLIERSQKAAQGDATPINTPEYMMVTIARNYIRDLMRRERRIIPLQPEALTLILSNEEDSCVQMEEYVIEKLYYESLFLHLAHEIALFPPKQRRALLIDLANRMHFGEQSTPLQAAFLAVGIDLKDYRQPLPDNPVERTRHASLVYYAYKRLSQLACRHYYEEAA